MKIAFFSEGTWSGKLDRDYNDLRTDLAWITSLKADHYNIHGDNDDELETNGKYDLGVIIIPKKNPLFSMEKMKKHCKRLASMQEGPHWFFQDYPLSQQVGFYNTLQEMDFLFVHNEMDKKYFEGLVNKECKILPSLMIEDSVTSLDTVKRENVIIGGNFCSWYGGFDSYIVAQKAKCPIFIPSMGRKKDEEERMPGLNHIPYVTWKNWIELLNNFKYGVHLMRTHAAGTFALNCAFLGIPCIGYKGLDTQSTCHPDLTVNLGDLVEAKKLMTKLKSDKDFYDHCSNTSKKLYKKHYSESKFKKKWKENTKF